MRRGSVVKRSGRIEYGPRVPAFTAVIVLHDSEAELRRLLDSVDEQLAERPQLVVVDSGSHDGGAALAAARGAEVVALGANAGFGAASNAGVARASHDVTVLLNPDCELLDASLARLAEIARAHPGALHAPRLLNPAQTVQRSVHPLPGTAGALAGALVHPPLLPAAVRDRLEPHRATSPRTVGWAIAACLAGSTELLRRLGPFDPAVHLFAEDMELCLRARAMGVRTVLHPQVRLMHVGGHATLRTGEPYDLLARRRRAAIAGTLGSRAVRADDAAQALTFATRAAGHALLGGDADRPRAQLVALHRARSAAEGPVLLVAYASVLGGAERVLLGWASALAPPIVLACPEGPLAEAARAAGLMVAPLRARPLRLRGAHVAAALALAGLARDLIMLEHRLAPAAVVASGQRPVLAAAALRSPVIALHHELPTGPLLARAVRWATGRCRAVVAVSETIADALGPRAEVLHPGVDLDHWRLPPASPPRRALVLGALVPWKRADLALEVAALVPDLELEVAGTSLPGDPPDFVDALRDRAARPDLAGRVTFSGALADPRPALARAHVLLHCADREPYGLAVVEALAASRPVVAPAAGGPYEILGGTGAGRLYPPGDVVEAARALRSVLADPDAPAAARARAEAAFDGSEAARRFAAVVEALRLPTAGPAGPP
jgi:GT2 family glycosyltransferase/glycosyltransferase involved in cell wall biosynthesis